MLKKVFFYIIPFLSFLLVSCVGDFSGLGVSSGSSSKASSSSCSPEDQKKEAQIEVSLLIDEAARMTGHNLDMLSKIYELDIASISGIIMHGYLENQISAETPESAIHSIDYLNSELFNLAVEKNGCEPDAISAVKNDPGKLIALYGAISTGKSLSEVYQIILEI
ncbi:MAG: hypothetical protein A2Y33_03275 [Spirochaetes bacterium GWF1_51_8]|nr:MAG: hypothetical protein A2Y33_03275 [Spirochaetes bacterium GWF1_51_8]